MPSAGARGLRQAFRPEEALLPGAAIAVRRGACREHGLEVLDHLGTFLAGEVKGSAFDQTFHRLAVDGARIHPGREILERAEWATGFPLGDGFTHGCFAHIFDAAQTEADSHVSVVLLGRELQHALVEIGRKDGQAHALGLVDVEGNFVGVIDLIAQHGAHEFDRIVRFEPAHAVADERVGRAVALVEPVVGKLFQQVENGLGFFFRDVVVLPATGDEVDPFLGHLLLVLLAHGATQEVGLSEAVAGEQVGRLLDLLLVNEDAVGFFGHLFEERMIVIDLHLALLALDVVGNQRHRTRTVERAERVHVVEAVETEVPAIAGHATFKLENADRLAAIEHIEGRLVIDRNLLDVEVRRLAPDQLLGVADDGERLEPEEIHLEHPEVGQGLHRILRDDLVFLSARQRQDLREIAVADDHSGGMDARIAREPLEHGRIAPQLLRAGLGFDGLLEFRVFLPRRTERDV